MKGNACLGRVRPFSASYGGHGQIKRSRDFHLGSHWLIPSPRYFAKLFSENPYCMIGNAWQAAVLFTGAL